MNELIILQIATENKRILFSKNDMTLIIIKKNRNILGIYGWQYYFICMLNLLFYPSKKKSTTNIIHVILQK